MGRISYKVKKLNKNLKGLMKFEKLNKNLKDVIKYEKSKQFGCKGRFSRQY